ncbi:MAG TPA: hypothetical protein PK400_11260 [Phycisphaerales bacterium]|nr:hypothetical protein [Phycisphaerales bacterium]HRQ74759.1 hypothetical protein [Phycisphaerales bacterium]
MSQFFSNKFLRYRGLIGPEARVIDTDLPCRNCSYNLRGLPSDRVCPECGAPIRKQRPAEYSLLSDAPLAEIKQLRLGLWMAMASLVATPIVMLVSTIMSVRSGSDMVIKGGFVLLSLMWAAAVWLMTPGLQTPEAVRHGFSRESKLRLAARYSQLAWPAAMLLILLGATGAASSLGWISLLVLQLVGIAGLMTLSVVLSRLADWCCDEFAGRLLNITLWALPISTFVFLTMPFISVMRFFVCMASALWLAAMGTFLLSLVSVTISVSWSVFHAKQRLAREQRAREKAANAVARLPRFSDDEIPLADGPLPRDRLSPVPIGPSTAMVSEDVEEDADCLFCGYNLRGLKTYGRCPECGERVARSYTPRT